MFLEILIALWVSLTLRVGNVGAMFVVLGASIPIVLLVVYILNGAVNFFFGDDSASTSKASKSLKKREEQIRAMNMDELAEWLERRPRDFEAREELCRRLHEAGDQEAYAEESERLLSLNPNIDIEERSMRHHKLADLYLGPLNKPEKAREILDDFIENYSETSQAQMMRLRLERL